jgi:hypothetical protein
VPPEVPEGKDGTALQEREKGEENRRFYLFSINQFEQQIAINIKVSISLIKTRLGLVRDQSYVLD